MSFCAVLTETQVRAQLHLEEEQRLIDGGESLHATTPSAFIMHGLDLEDTQYVVVIRIYLRDLYFILDVAFVVLPMTYLPAPHLDNLLVLPNSGISSARD